MTNELMTTAEAAAIKGMKLTTAYKRVSGAGLKPVKIEGMNKYYRAKDLLDAFSPLRTAYDPPEGWMTVRQFCEHSGHKDHLVRRRAAERGLEPLEGAPIKAFRISELEEAVEGPPTRDGWTRGRCSRCRRYDEGMDVRGGLCLDCWCHDYCVRKGI